MKTYQIEIEELSTGKRVKLAVPGCGWTDDSAEAYRTKMCDCNLAGYFHNEVKTRNGITSSLPHQLVAGNWLAENKCDHSMPPTRFMVIAAHLDAGRVIPL